MKKLFLALVIIVMGFVPLAAATVSVLVIETGLPPETGLSPSASVWESGVMDAFFDAGFIVSNAPSMQLAKASGSKLPPEARREFEEARLGGADLFVVVHLNYPASAGTASAAEQNKSVYIAVFSVSSGEVIHETSMSSRSWGNSNEEFMIAKQNTGNIILRLKG